MIDVKHVTFTYDQGSEAVLKDLSFSIPRGTITAIIGLSGCGKSTLCQVISGIIPRCIPGDLSGEIRVGDRDIQRLEMKELARQIGYVMQDPDRQLVAETVEDELAFAPENLGKDPAQIRKLVDDTMALLGIETLALRNPSQLSGGQKQVVAIGAILTLNPDVLILDEPMSHLDEAGRGVVGQVLKTLAAEGKTIVVVEHDYTAMDFADQWIVMDQGAIGSVGRPEEIIGEISL